MGRSRGLCNIEVHNPKYTKTHISNQTFKHFNSFYKRIFLKL